MGALDFLKDLQGKVVDAATYQLLERNFQMQTKNNVLLREKNKLLQDKIAKLTTRLKELEARLSYLPPKPDADEFVELDGVFFKKINDKFSTTPYCLKCHKILSNPRGRLFVCQACKYTKQMRLPVSRCMEIPTRAKPATQEGCQTIRLLGTPI